MRNRKSIAIIGEGETEWFYFDSLRIAKRLPFKLSPELPSHPDIESMLRKAERCISEGYDRVVCIVDMDRFRMFPTDMQRYRQFRSSKRFSKVEFIETDPCTEFWFLLHFLPSGSRRSFPSYDALLPELRRYIPAYEKSIRFFRRCDIYKFLVEHGDLEQAKSNAARLSELSRQYPEDRIAYSEVHKVFILLDEMLDSSDKKQ